jgi:uncharacterized protein YqeY
MTTRDRLESDIRDAMRSRNQGRLDALRFLKNAIQMTEKDQMTELDETGVLDVVAKQVKDRRESIRMFQEGGRDDLVAKESAELTILEAYLPPQLGQEELVQIVQAVIAEVGAASMRDKGRVMGKVMPQIRGKADGSQVNALVDELLASAGES